MPGACVPREIRVYRSGRGAAGSGGIAGGDSAVADAGLVRLAAEAGRDYNTLEGFRASMRLRAMRGRHESASGGER